MSDINNTEEKLLNVELEVFQWNVIVSTIHPMFFAETQAILDSIERQVKELHDNGVDRKGRDMLTLQLSRKEIEALVVTLQNLPYNVISRAMYVLFEVLHNDIVEKQGEASGNEEPEAEPETEPEAKE